MKPDRFPNKSLETYLNWMMQDRNPLLETSTTELNFKGDSYYLGWQLFFTVNASNKPFIKTNITNIIEFLFINSAS